MANDFFVRFGSNARSWAKGLDKDLQPARGAIAGLAKQLADIEQRAANRRASSVRHLAAISNEADRVQAKLDKIESSGQVSSEAAEVRSIATNAVRDIAAVSAEMDGMIAKLNRFMEGIGRAGPEVSKARESERRSESQRTGQPQQSALRDPNTGRRVAAGTPGAVPFYPQAQAAPAGGQDRTAAIAAAVNRVLATRGSGGGATAPVEVANIPKATIDEAAFERVVKAVTDNVAATERVEQAVDRVVAALNSSGEGAQADAAVEAKGPDKTTAKGATADTQPQLSSEERARVKRSQGLRSSIAEDDAAARKLRSEIEDLSGQMQEGAAVSELFGRKLAEVEAIERRLASNTQALESGESAAQQRERQTRAAQRELARTREVTLDPDERNRRRDERARLALAADPNLGDKVGRGAGQLGKAQLQEIAATLTRQGYPTDTGPTRRDTGVSRLSTDELLSRIAASGQAFKSARGATAEDLNLYRATPETDKVSGDVKSLLSGEIGEMNARFQQEMGRLGLSAEESFELLGKNLRSGGDSPLDRVDADSITGSRSHRRTDDEVLTFKNRGRTKGRLAVGAEIGDEGRDRLNEAGEQVRAFQRARQEAARNDAIRAFRQDPNFDPSRLRGQVEGKGPEAKEARRGLGALIGAVEELDRFATRLGELDDRLVAAQRAQASVLRALDGYENLDREPTREEADQYTQDLARAQDLDQEVRKRREALETEKSLYKDPDGGTADYLLAPEHQERLKARNVERYDEETRRLQEGDSVKDDYLNRQALRQATFEQLASKKIFGTNTGNTRDFTTSTLPGVSNVGGELKFADDAKNSTAENREALTRMNRGVKSYISNLNKLIDETASGAASEDRLNELRAKAARGIGKLLSSYQQAFPTAPIPDQSSYLPEDLGFTKDFYESDTGQQIAQSDQARATQSQDQQIKRDELLKAAEASYKDPDRAARLQKELGDVLSKRIKAEKENLAALRAQRKTATGEDATALDAQIKQGAANLEAVQRQRRNVLGKPKASDLEEQYEKVAAEERALARGEQRLTKITEDLVKAREELVAREQTTRERLNPESQGEFDALRAERDSLTAQKAEIERSPDLRADAGEGAFESESIRRAESARAALGQTDARLNEVTNSLSQFERFASSLDPDTELKRRDVPRDEALRGGRRVDDLTTESLQQRTSGLEEQRRSVKQNLGATAGQLNKLQAELAETTVAFQASQAKLDPSRRQRDPKVPGFGAGDSGAGDGGGGGDTTAAEGSGDGRSDDILRQILAAINRVNATLKGTLKVAGNVRTDDGGAAAGNVAATQAAARSTRTARSTPQGRADFLDSAGAANPAIREYVASGDDVKAAAALMSEGILNQTQVLELFRDKLGQTAKEAQDFKAAVTSAAGDLDLAKAADAAADERARGQAKAADAQQKEADNSERAARRKAKALEQSNRQERLAAQAAAAHAAVLERLGPATRAEVAELERLAAASRQGAASQEQLAAQMAKVYRAAARDLRGTGAQETNAAVGQVFKGAGIDASNDEVLAARKTARALGGQMDQAAASGVTPGGLFGEQSAFTQAMFGNSGFWSRIMASTGTFIVRNFTAGFVFGLTNAMQQVIGQAIQTEATFVRVSHALEATGRSAQGLRGDLQDISTTYGTQLNDVYDTAAGLTGLFETPQEIAGATEVVSQLQLISGGALTAQEAMGALASIQGAFASELGTGVDGLQKVADVLTSVQNNVGTNVEVTAEAVGRMSGLAAQLGLEYEEVAVYGAQIAKLTNQTGAAAGEQFSRILSAFQTGSGRAAIQEAFGQFDGGAIATELNDRDISGVLQRMSRYWDDLSDSQQQNLSVTLAGQRQAAAFAALMNNGEQSLNAIRRAQDSYGEATDRVQEIMKTLNGQIAKLGSNFQNIANNLVRSGVLDWVILLLQGVNFVIDGFNDLFSTINDFVDQSPLLGFLVSAGAGLAAFALTLSLIKRSFAGFKATLAGIPAVQRFQEGAAGASRPLGNPAARQQRALGAFGANRQGVSANRGFFEGSPRIASALGGRLDRMFLTPLQRAGTGLSRFGANLNAQAARMATTGALGPGAVGPGLTARQLQQVSARSQFTALQGRAFSGVGNFINTGARTLRSPAAAAGRSSERLAASATLRQQAAQRLTSQAMFARGNESYLRSLRVQAAALRGQAGLSRGASRTMSGLSATLGKLGKSGVGADAAMLGLGLAIAGIITASARAAQAGRAVEDIFEARAKAEDEGKDGGRDYTYTGPASDAAAEQFDSLRNGGFDAGLELGGNYIKDLGSGVAATFTGGAVGNLKDIAKPFTGETVDEMTGTADGMVTGLSEGQEAYNKYAKKISDLSDVGSITEASKGVQDTIAKKEQEIRESEDLSNQEKLAALRVQEQVRDLFLKTVEDQLAVANGLASVGLLEVEQIGKIGAAADALGSQQGSEVRRLAGGSIDEIVQRTGVTDDTNPEIRASLDRLAAGGLDDVEVAKEKRKLIRERLKHADTKYQAAASGIDQVEPEEVDARQEVVVGLMGDLTNSTTELIDAHVARAQSIAEEALARGDFDRSDAQLRKAINEIEGKKPDLRVRPGKKAFGDEFGDLSVEDRQYRTGADRQKIREANAEQRGIVESLAEQRQARRNEALLEERAQGLSQVAGAENSLAEARTNLRVLENLKRKYGAAGPSYQAIQGAKLEVLRQEASLAEILDSSEAAGFALRAAQTWSQAAQDQINLEGALNALSNARDRFEPGSAERKQARTAAVQARKQAITNQDSRDAAAREAAIAALPQGDAVGLANAQVSSAQAALAAAEKYGRDSTEYQGALAALYNAQQGAQQAQAGVASAQAQLAQAYAQASGDAVAAARAGVAVAQAQLAAAQQQSGGALTAEVLSAQAALVSANDAVGDAQVALVQSRMDVSIAIANAAGQSVRAARLQVSAGLAALQAATPGTAEYNAARVQVIQARDAVQQSVIESNQAAVGVTVALADAAGHVVRAARLQVRSARIALRGASRGTAEHAQARAEVISARAAARDAALQDRLDTIDFNLEMGRITQQSAIAALRQILRTRDLTKQQRRQLLLQIKGMKDELSNDQFNFGNIRLPTPYQVRRYIEQQKVNNARRLDAAAAGATSGGGQQGGGGGVITTSPRSTTNNYQNETTIQINGADTAKVKRIIQEVVGGRGDINTRTSQPRRR